MIIMNTKELVESLSIDKKIRLLNRVGRKSSGKFNQYKWWTHFLKNCQKCWLDEGTKKIDCITDYKLIMQSFLF